jgi:hypothetical protein
MNAEENMIIFSNQYGESLLVKVKVMKRPELNIIMRNAHDAHVSGFIKKTTAPMIKQIAPRTHVSP